MILVEHKKSGIHAVVTYIGFINTRKYIRP